MATVLAIGDTHFPGMRDGYVDFLWDVKKKYDCDRFVHIGDAVDWHAMSFHERHAELSSTAREVSETVPQWKEMLHRFPKADLMLGNHDVLPERQAHRAGMGRDMVKGFKQYWRDELKAHGVKFNWRVHPRYAQLVIDGVIYSHCEGVGGPTPALELAKRRFRSVVGGHHHSKAGVWYFANDEFRIFGMNVGTGMDRDKLQFDYGSPMPQKPMLGCGVVVDGKQAYFEPWLLKSR